MGEGFGKEGRLLQNVGAATEKAVPPLDLKQECGTAESVCLEDGRVQNEECKLRSSEMICVKTSNKTLNSAWFFNRQPMQGCK